MDARGLHLANFVANNNMNVINDRIPTRRTYHSKTAINLTIVSAVLQPDINSIVLQSPR